VRSRSRRLFLWILALALPLFLVVLGGQWFWAATERSPPEGGSITLFQLALTAAPFLILALLATVAREAGAAFTVAAIAGAVMSAGLWLAYYFAGYVYWRDHLRPGSDGGGGGADFGVMFLLLFSPLFVGGAMFLAFRVARLRRGAQEASTRT